MKPHYALHGVLNHVLVTKNKADRKEFCAALAGQLAGGHTKYVRGYLCQELQWAGREEAVPALGKLLLDEDLAEPAKMALVAIGTGATEQFLAALGEAKGKCRLAVIHGLAALAEHPAADPLREALTDPDREVRIAAGAGLAKLGNAAACESLLKAAATGPGWSASNRPSTAWSWRKSSRRPATSPRPPRSIVNCAIRGPTPRRSTSAMPPTRPWRAWLEPWPN